MYFVAVHESGCGTAVAWPLAAYAQHYFEAKRVGAGDAIGKRGGPARIGGKIAAPIR